MKNSSETIINNILKILPVNIFMLLVMFACRIAFFTSFGGSGAFDKYGQYLFHAFVLGFRFDLSMLAYANIPVIIIILFLFSEKKPVFFQK